MDREPRVVDLLLSCLLVRVVASPPSELRFRGLVQFVLDVNQLSRDVWSVFE